MADIRKQIMRPDVAQQNQILHVVHQHLLAITERGARAIGGTGASFVIIGIGLWAAELADLDGRATARFLRALADIFDPKTNDNQKRRAEEQRSKAVRDLYSAVDLDMNKPEGSA